MTMPDRRDDDSAPAPPSVGFCQELRKRLRDVLGDDLDRPRDKTPGEAVNFSTLETRDERQSR